MNKSVSKQVKRQIIHAIPSHYARALSILVVLFSREFSITNAVRIYVHKLAKCQHNHERHVAHDPHRT